MRVLQIYVLTALLLLAALPGRASRVEKGFEALRIYDYFLARKLFYQQQKKQADPYAAYGLAVIFSRSDNPFSNIDSAGKYIQLSYQAFGSASKTQTLGGFTVSKASILELSDTISQKMFVLVKRINSVNAYNFFLRNFYLAKEKLRRDAAYARDELEFNAVLDLHNSDSTRQFMQLHPQSAFYMEASMLMQRQLYDENTSPGNAASYVDFLKKYPGNVMVKTAQEKLFAIYRQQNNIQGLAAFVQDYPSAYQALEAWKLLFSLSVKEFSFDELKNFVRDYPDFPLKNSILKELELNRIVLYPYEQGDFSGFIDDKGKFVIKPVFDAASDFHEGLSLVSKNDSVYFINKQNVNPFGKIYTDASVFRNGIAPVKQNGKWFFINRQGQTISGLYDEINELSDNVYVVKAGDRYGALDHFGQMLLEPKFDKLGDFKNGYAYYTEKGSYGFVSRNGSLHKAEFEWISDFSSEKVAIIKQNGKYGLVTAPGKILLEPAYDQIIKTNYPVFIVISGSLYGFFSAGGCFISQVAYDFMREKSPDYYTNGVLFKLLKKNEQALVDGNGHIYINFGTYQEIHFPHNELMRVRQKNKFGYLDKRLVPVIPYKYQAATDFADSLALVKVKDNNVLITTYGAEIFSTGAEIVKLSRHYYSVNDDERSIINSEAELIFTDVENVQRINNALLIITLNNGEIKLIYD